MRCLICYHPVDCNRVSSCSSNLGPKLIAALYKILYISEPKCQKSSLFSACSRCHPLAVTADEILTELEEVERRAARTRNLLSRALKQSRDICDVISSNSSKKVEEDDDFLYARRSLLKGLHDTREFIEIIPFGYNGIEVYEDLSELEDFEVCDFRQESGSEIELLGDSEEKVEEISKHYEADTNTDLTNVTDDNENINYQEIETPASPVIDDCDDQDEEEVELSSEVQAILADHSYSQSRLPSRSDSSKSRISTKPNCPSSKTHCHIIPNRESREKALRQLRHTQALKKSKRTSKASSRSKAIRRARKIVHCNVPGCEATFRDNAIRAAHLLIKHRDQDKPSGTQPLQKRPNELDEVGSNENLVEKVEDSGKSVQLDCVEAPATGKVPAQNVNTARKDSESETDKAVKSIELIETDKTSGTQEDLSNLESQSAGHVTSSPNSDPRKETNLYKSTEVSNASNDENDSACMDDNPPDFLDDGDENECRRCGENFLTLALLRKHQLEEHPRRGRNFCPYEGCDKEFDDESNLISHFFDPHGWLKPHQSTVYRPGKMINCGTCDRTFDSIPLKLKHKLEEHPEEFRASSDISQAPCQMCGKTFPNMKLFRHHIGDHRRRQAKGNWACRACGKSFPFRRLREAHQQKEHGSCTHPCLYEGCGKIVEKSVDLICHLFMPHEFHNKPQDLQSKEFKCPVCSNPFAGFKLLRKHLVTKHPDEAKSRFLLLPCQMCAENFSSVENLREHLQNTICCPDVVPEDISCPYTACNKAFDLIPSLHQHLLEFHVVQENEAEGIEPGAFICPVCDRTFDEFTVVRQHMLTRHPTHATGENAPLHCQHCGKLFHDVSYLQTHVKTHSVPEEPVSSSLPPRKKRARTDFLPGESNTCERCGKEMRNRVLLRQHLLSCLEKLEGVEKNHICSTCGKAFFQEKALKTHARLHSRTRSHVCDVCGRQYSSNAEMVRHRRKHFPDEQLACHICSAKFCMPHKLKKHINFNHLGIGGRKCPHCDYRCLSRRDMEVHVRIHTGERPYMCDICGLTFRNNYQMNSHRKAHQGKRFKCDKCGHEFFYRYRYLKHMETHKYPKIHWKTKQKLEREAKNANSEAS